MRIILVCCALVICFPVQASAAGRVEAFLTTGDLHATLARQPDLRFGTGPATGESIAVDPAQKGQELTAGFGVAMTDTSAELLHDELPAPAAGSAMAKLFSRLHGLGLTFLRIPIAGSDYVLGRPYSYDDMPPGGSDPSLAHFSIDHDRAYILPAIRQALALAGGRMTVMANPWTPPAWMKTDDQLVTTTGPLGQLLPQYYGAYAAYLVRFLEAYRDAGVQVDYLGVQNEPLTPLLLVAGIPESFLDPVAEGRMISSSVAPALNAAGLHPGILAYDDGYERSEAYIPVVMGLAGKDVAGFAYHCYLSDPASIPIEAGLFPGRAQLETECSSKLSEIRPQQMAIRNLREGAQGIQLWNAALDQKGGPKIGNGCKGLIGPSAGVDCIAPLTVNTQTHTFTETSDYWALAHFSRFIRPGARRIASRTPSNCPTTPVSGWDCGLEDVAFENADGSRVLVATANDGKAHAFTVSQGGERFTTTIPDGGTETFVWDDRAPAITGVRVRARMLDYALSADAVLTLTVRRRGRRVAVRVVDGREGAGALRLPRLRAGSYRVSLTATDPSTGDRSPAVRRAFRVG